MYIGYLHEHDRQELGFNCLKDIHTIKQLSNLKSTRAIRILKKGKQTLVLLFSKEALIAVLIFIKSTPDFGISIVGKSIEELSVEYKDCALRSLVSFSIN